MTNEQQYFIQLLRGYLNHRDTPPSGEMDWVAIMKLAQIHQFSCIVHHQCGQYMPIDLRFVMGQLSATASAYFKVRFKHIEDIRQAFTQVSIPFILFKGTEIAQYYPWPEQRCMGDTDILVHPEDTERAASEMQKIGFELKRNDLNEWIFFREKLKYELHFHLLYDAPFNSTRDQEFCKDVWKYAQKESHSTQYILDWSFHFMFILIHLKKHLLYCGAGFRQFMDLAVIALKVPLDWNRINQWITQLQMEPFARRCFGLAQYWFDVSLPNAADDISDNERDIITEEVMRNGSGGYVNEDNSKNYVFSNLKQSGKSRLSYHLGIIWRACFPPLSYFSTPPYDFLKKYPFLLPVAWVYRFFRGVFSHRVGVISKQISSETISQQEIKRREQFLELWKLTMKR